MAKLEAKGIRKSFGENEVCKGIDLSIAEGEMVCLIGASGSGKSSVVKAGLAARLDAAGQSVLVTEMYPGAYPFEELDGALRRVAVRLPPGDDGSACTGRPGGIGRAGSHAANHHPRESGARPRGDRRREVSFDKY